MCGDQALKGGRLWLGPLGFGRSARTSGARRQHVHRHFGRTDGYKSGTSSCSATAVVVFVETRTWKKCGGGAYLVSLEGRPESSVKLSAFFA